MGWQVKLLSVPTPSSSAKQLSREPLSPIDTILPYRPDSSEGTPVAVAARYAEERRQLAPSLTTEEQGLQKFRRDN